MGFFGVFITFMIIFVVGGLGAYIVYIKTRPKKEVWSAKIYQLSPGSHDIKINKDGVIIGELKIKDLVPYAKDILERVEKDPGITVYRLKRLNKTTPAVDMGTSENWGETKEVAVLYHEGTCTLLKKGFEVSTGSAVFTPLPHDRISMMKGEMAIRKDRLRKEKDILEAISPWIVAGIIMMSLVFIAYWMGSAMITISDNLEEVSTACQTGQVTTQIPQSNPGKQFLPSNPSV